MSFSINTNNNAMAALQSLSTTATALSESQNKISTGKKVSQASDNPAVYSIAQTMNANIAGLSAVSDSLNLGTAVLKTASSAADNISSTLAGLQQTVTQAQQTGINRETMQAQIDAAVKQINQFANSSTFNGVNLLAGSNASVLPKDVTSSNLNIVQDVNGGTMAIDNMMDSPANNMAMQLGLASGTDAGTNLQVNASAVQFSFAKDTELESGDTFTLENEDGTIDIFEFSDGNAPLASTPTVGANATRVHAVMIETATDSLTSKLSALASQMNSSGFSAAMDSKGNLVVMGKGVAATSSADLVTGTATASAIGGGSAAVTIVQSAVTKMNDIQAKLGASSQQVAGMAKFTSTLSSAMTSGVGALTDVDLAAESARLTSLQTKQQLAIQSLSIANQQPQALLSLFR